MLLNVNPRAVTLLLILCSQHSQGFNNYMLGSAPFTRSRSSSSSSSSSLFVSVGLGPGEDSAATTAEDSPVVIPEVIEEPDHELFRRSRMSKTDEKCDAWYTALLGTTPGALGEISQRILDKIRTPVELKEEVQLPPSDPQYTAYVRKFRQPGQPIVPAFGCENYSVPVVRRKAEAWRQFDVVGMIGTDYSRLPNEHASDLLLDESTAKKYASALKAKGVWLDDEGEGDESSCSARLVYVNGRFCPSLSTTNDVVRNLSSEDVATSRPEIKEALARLPDGFTDELVGDEKGLLEECGHTKLSTLSAPHHNTGNPTDQFAINNQQGMAAFAALNTVRTGSVALVDAPKGHKEDKPILIVNAVTPDGGVDAPSSDEDDPAGVAHHPRLLVLADDDSELSIVQSSVDLDDDDSSTTVPKLYNGYTQMFVRTNATVKHIYVEETGGLPTASVDLPGPEHDEARRIEAARPALRDTHLECIDVHLVESGSAYEGTMAGVGGSGRSKIALTTTLLRPDARCDVNGLSLAGGDQTVDMRTTIHHVAHGTTSEQNQRNMVGGRAVATFKGRIRVEQSAQQTESDQIARTLLLSDRARIWAIPTLEIIADDVKCTHGATISDLSEEQLFYLRSRGVDRQTSRNMIMYAFVDDVGRGIEPDFLYGKGRLKDRIVKRLQNLVPTGDRSVMGEFQSV